MPSSARSRPSPWRWRTRATSTFTAAAIVASAVVAVTASPTPLRATNAATASSDPVADGSMSEEDKALQDAQTSGQPVELVSARTEASDTWAQPDGSFSVKRHGTAVRLWRDGAWVATDPTLAFATDGSVVPKAASVAVKFSGGGTGPMLSGVKDGRTLSLSWPKPLPKPTLDGNVATYPEVLAGVDLQLKAEVEGFSQLLVVKTAEAAENPELAQLQFAMDTVGLTVDKDADTGTLVATDPAGQTVFTSPAPLMWDSSPPATPAAQTFAAAEAGDTPAPGDAFEPGVGAEDAQMATAVTGDTLTITPDQDLLTGSETIYPVYIDPSWAWGEWQHWTRVYKHYPKNSYWDAKEVVRVGYESETGGSDRISRSFFQLDTSDVVGAKVKDATFRVRNTWSWSCQDRPVELFEVGDISKKTTWNNQPGKIGAALDTVDDAKGWGSSCPAGNLEFDATRAVSKAAENGEASVTLGLYAASETDTFGWKKFDPKTATLEITYNHAPKPPSGLGTNPRTSCTAGGIIGNTTVSLYATIDDDDAGNLTAQFQAFKTGTSAPVVDISVPALRRRVATVVLPAASTPSGDYTWKVRATDADGAPSDWSPTCKFTLDRTRPSKPPTISSDGNKFPNGDQGWPTTTGGARTQGRFLFSPNGVTDVQTYFWWTDTDPQVRPASKLAAWADVTPPSYGPHLVYAYSVDAAGNRSDTASYLYYAIRAQERDKPGDLNGDGPKDIWSVDSNGTLLTHAGQGNRQFSAATNGGGTFPGQQVTYSGDWGQDGYNDLISLEYNANDNKNKLRVYRNNGTGVINDADYIPLSVSCPVPRTSGRCKGEAGWAGDDHWYNAQQITTGGDINDDGMADVLVKQGKNLWVYYGNRSAQLDKVRPHPILVGESDWDKFTVVVPGDVNGDKLPDLLLRDNLTGDLYRSYGTADPDGILDAATWGRAASRVKIATGTMPQSLYPTIGSSGDLDGDGNGDGVSDGDGIPDLWARKKDNTLTGRPGTLTNGQYGIGAAYTIDGTTGGSRIAAGTRLTSGQSVTSTSAKLTMQSDGNLVITSNANKALWSSGTAGNPDATARIDDDGNITVYKADGTTKLWGTNLTATNTPNLLSEGYVLLQDRGNLIVYNAKGQSLWSSGSAIRHDYNRDGRSDFGAWYNYADGSDAAWSFLTNSDGTFQAPSKAFESAAGNWNTSNMKVTTGDYNGDGYGDAAVLYGYDTGGLKLWTFLGKAGGGYNTPFSSWNQKSGATNWANITLQTGDFNGDGRDDIATWESYTDGRDILRTYTADVRGGFNAPFASWSSPTTGWYLARSKFLTGDFNGDGRDDISIFYDYLDTSVKMWTFSGTTSGGFAAPEASWTNTTWGDWARTTVHAGDFNGDGRDDIAAWYDYADGHDSIFTIPSNTSGSFGAAFEAWTAPIGSMWRDHMKIVTGDYNGDGRDDVGAMYGYDDGRVKMWTWSAKPGGYLNAPVGSWEAPAGNWSVARTAVFERHSQ